MKRTITRRTVLKTGVALAGALAMGRTALAKELTASNTVKERPTLVVFWLNGGPAGLFNSAGSFLSSGAFGVTHDNVRDLGNGLIVDAASWGALPSAALARMASINFIHGIARPHEKARAAVLEYGSRNQLLRLAAAMPADAAVRCAVVNSLGLPKGINAAPAAEGGVCLERIAAFDEMRGFPAPQLDTIRRAYGVPADHAAIDDPRATFAGVEVLVHAGSNVILAQPAYSGRPDRQFDTHTDDTGMASREVMAPITPSLTTFLERVMALPERNVVTLLVGEFSRTLPASDHATGGTATVIGKYVKTGTTGPQRPDGAPPADAPPPGALWAYAAAALRLDTTPFGRNPHAQLLRR